jgi:hypothetical protein
MVFPTAVSYCARYPRACSLPPDIGPEPLAQLRQPRVVRHLGAQAAGEYDGDAGKALLEISAIR